MLRALVASLLIALVIATPAIAGSLSENELNGIVDSWIARWYPDRVNYCAGDAFRVKVTRDLPMQGYSHGWNGPSWDPTRCSAEIRAGMPKPAVCFTWWHEKLHFLLGPGHTGPLALTEDGMPAACRNRR